MTEKRVLFVNVTDTDYPRHKMLANAFSSVGYEVVVLPRRNDLSYGARCVDLLKARPRGAEFNIVVLAEFALSYVWVSWILSRTYRATHVVDGFIGMYETHVEDTGLVKGRSVKGVAYKFVDWLALFLSDHFLIDTHTRRERLAAAHPVLRRMRPVHVLPVGAPPWATPLPASNSEKPIRFLYYGNYIPLHGLEKFLEALSVLGPTGQWSATLIGPLSKCHRFERLVEQLDIADFVNFIDSVPEGELLSYISSHDVVVGIFGDSPKARSVIPNKVWQGLATGRIVLTRQTQGLEEISDLFPRTLVLTPAESASDIVEPLKQLLKADTRTTSAADARVIVDNYVAHHYAHFMANFA